MKCVRVRQRLDDQPLFASLFQIEYDLQEVDTFPGITNAMISVPSPTTHGPGPTPPGGPAVAAGGGGVGGPPLQQPAPLTIDCGGGGGGGSGGAGLLRARTGVGSPRRGKKRSESGGSASSGSTPGSWEEAMSQMSRELHVICRSPDNLVSERHVKDKCDPLQAAKSCRRFSVLRPICKNMLGPGGTSNSE